MGESRSGGACIPSSKEGIHARPLDMEKPAEDRGSAGGLLKGVEIPTDLPPVPAKTVRVFGVRFEVHNHPGRLFQECEVDHGFKDASIIVFYQDRQFAVGAAGVPGAVKERML